MLPHLPTEFVRGATGISGTNPQAIVKVGTVNEFDWAGDAGKTAESTTLGEYGLGHLA